jgi:uncharacterized protein (TIGR00730 family)
MPKDALETRRPAALPPDDATARRRQEMVRELLEDATGLLKDRVTVGDLKIARSVLDEMRAAFALFEPYHHVRKVSTFGSARTREGDPTFRLAERFARTIANRGFMVITGAGGGIMEACQRGAGRERSFGVNIRLPHEQEANAIIQGDPKLLSFRYFFIRKLFFIKETHAVVLFPGGFGTQDEGFEVLTLLQTGKCQPMPLICLDRPRGTYWKSWDRYVRDHLLQRKLISPDDLSLYSVTDRVEDAVNEIEAFYRVYHSARYVRDLLVLRLNRPLTDEHRVRLAEEFADIIVDGKIEQRRALPAERNEPEIWHLPRLALRFNRFHYGRLRRLLDAINEHQRSR